MPHLEKMSYQDQMAESSLKIKALAREGRFFDFWPKVGHVLWIRWGIPLISLQRWGMRGAGWLHAHQAALYRGAWAVFGPFVPRFEGLY